MKLLSILLLISLLIAACHSDSLPSAKEAWNQDAVAVVLEDYIHAVEKNRANSNKALIFVIDFFQENINSMSKAVPYLSDKIMSENYYDIHKNDISKKYVEDIIFIRFEDFKKDTLMITVSALHVPQDQDYTVKYLSGKWIIIDKKGGAIAN